MTTAQASFLLSLVVIVGVTLWANRTRRFDWLGVGMSLSLIVGTWSALRFSDAPVEVRAVVAVIFLLLYCLHSGRMIFKAWGLCDLIVVALAIWQVVVSIKNQEFTPLSPARAYGEWCLPYFAGRFAVLNREAIARLSPWFTNAIIAIAVLSLIESLFGTNLWDEWICPIDDQVTRPLERRYGLLYRAVGPMRHPIFLGVLLILSLPWVVSGGRRLARAWSVRIGLAAIVVGVVCTVSRGPLAGLLIAGLVWLALSYRHAATVIVAFGLLTVAIAYARPDLALQAIDFGVRPDNRSKIVEVDGSAEVYTGTTNRLFVMRIYGPAVIKGGVFGYGTRRTSTFPPDIPGLPSDAKSRKRLGIVDNSYVLVGLRLGLVGVALLVLLFLSAVFECLQTYGTADTLVGDGTSTYLKVSACSLVAAAAVLTTVYFAFDHAFWLLFQLGTIGGLASARRLSLRQQLDEGA